VKHSTPILKAVVALKIIFSLKKLSKSKKHQAQN
jgi:hypothetical protein